MHRNCRLKPVVVGESPINSSACSSARCHACIHTAGYGSSHPITSGMSTRRSNNTAGCSPDRRTPCFVNAVVTSLRVSPSVTSTVLTTISPRCAPTSPSILLPLGLRPRFPANRAPAGVGQSLPQHQTGPWTPIRTLLGGPKPGFWPLILGRAKMGQKWPIFDPLRCKVVGEWGGSAH